MDLECLGSYIQFMVSFVLCKMVGELIQRYRSSKYLYFTMAISKIRTVFELTALGNFAMVHSEMGFLFRNKKKKIVIFIIWLNRQRFYES